MALITEREFRYDYEKERERYRILLKEGLSENKLPARPSAGGR
jgi:hypothetical protein